MATDNPDLIPPRNRPSRQFGWAVPIVCAVIGLSIFYVLNQRQNTSLRAMLDDGIEVTAMDRRFVFINRDWDYFNGKYVLSGGLIMTASSGHETFEISPGLYRALCGEILTKIHIMRDAPAGRSHLFRLALSFPVFKEGEPTGETYGPAFNNIAVDDGACPSVEAIEKLSFNTYPGVLRRWGLKGFYEFQSDLPDPPDIAAIFAARTGRVVPPLPFAEACQAALFDFDRLVPTIEKRPEKLAVVFLGKPAHDIASPAGEPGLGQSFAIKDGTCSAISDVLPLERGN